MNDRQPQFMMDDSVPWTEPLWVALDRSGRILRRTGRLDDLLRTGTPIETLADLPVPAEERACLHRELGHVFQGEPTAPVTLHVRVGDAQERCVEARFCPWIVADPVPTAAYLFRSIDRLVATQRQLEDLAEKFRMMTEASGDVIWMSEPTHRMTYISPAIVPHLGFTPEEYMALPPEGRFPPEELRMLADAFRREYQVARQKAARGERHSYVLELRHYHKDGSLRWGEVHVGFLFDRDGRLTGLQGITRNIHARKHAEEALARSEEHYRRLFEEHRLGLAVCEVIRNDQGVPVDARYLQVNPAYQVHVGLDPQAVIGRKASEIFTPEELSRGLATLEKVLSGVTCREDTYLPSLDRWFDATTWALSPDRYVVMVEDITQRRRLEQTAERAHRLESLGVLAGGIAHDFNNLLTGILGSLSLIAMETAHLDPVADLVRTAREACDRAQGLTRQLLAFSRGGEPVRERADLGRLIQQAAGFALAGTGVSCDYRFPGQPVFTAVDAGQIGQVIQNLVINAVQAMEGHGRLVIRMEPTGSPRTVPQGLGPGPRVRIDVEDSGPGIAPEHLSRIFEPYYTTRADGTGLGLAIAFRIVQRHGGTLTVESRPGQGACFSIWLPGEDQGPASRPVAPAGTPPGATLSRKVLVLEDHPSVQRMIRAMLERMGHRVDLFEDGDQAIAAWREARARGAPYDLGILDLVVPGRTGGRETAAAILQDDPEACLVVSSGYSQDGVLADHDRHGFRDRLPKPFHYDTVRALMDRLFPRVPSDADAGENP
ncbi:MAG TPA: ATP-binding protein [Myxococcota bacterium]|nr:ATP-binding protein [Myxococcota bacterium]HQK52548.1 ATP-binding protein [Myxococcota bacterium]